LRSSRLSAFWKQLNSANFSKKNGAFRLLHRLQLLLQALLQLLLRLKRKPNSPLCSLMAAQTRST
jgi:hypothetical protein